MYICKHRCICIYIDMNYAHMAFTVTKRWPDFPPRVPA